MMLGSNTRFWDQTQGCFDLTHDAGIEPKEAGIEPKDAMIEPMMLDQTHDARIKSMMLGLDP
jgi:hypothetical protein